MIDALATLPIPRRVLVVLLVALALMMVPHLANLSPAVLGLFAIALLWRLLALDHPKRLPGRGVLILLTIGAVILVITSTGLHDGRLTGTALLVSMLGLKLLELRSRRDVHITVFLGFFLALTQFLYNQSLWLAGYLLLGVAILIALQLSLSRVETDIKHQLRRAGMMLSAALPLALVVFLLFPRLHTPLWGINTDRAITGISGEMTLGNIGELSRSNATAFRVSFIDQVPTPEQRYWRGPVLWQTDGQRWQAGLRPIRASRTDQAGAAPVRYEITLEPTGEYWLFGLDTVTEAPPSSHINSNHALVGAQRVHRRFSYVAGSDPDYLQRELSAVERRYALQLPENVSPRVRALVDDWQTQTDAAKPTELVQKALDYFNREPFVYTLKPGRLDGDPIDTFLFETQRGFCEHYAGSFALLMRLGGIPSRVVIGYQGGDKNPHADHWVIRQSDAHAWTEVWLPELGWWRVDPTAAVAPERIEQSIDSALSEDQDQIVFRADTSGLFGTLWREAVWLADAVDFGWHRWVVGFDFHRQKHLLKDFGIEHLRGMGLAIALVVGCSLAITLVYLISRLPTPKRGDPMPRLWQSFRHKLRRAGMDTPAWQGPTDLCERATKTFPQQAGELAAIHRLYVQLRYGRHRDPRQVSSLRQRIARLKLKTV